MKRIFVTLIMIIGCLMAISTLYVAIGIWQLGHSWSEMDWNRDGLTSIEEILASLDIGRRADPDNPACTEFFSLKDGLPVGVRCP